MTDLEIILRDALAEKQEKLIPENIRKDVTIFNVKGTLEEGEPIINQDKTITENGEYTADTGYTGLGTVTVNVSGGGAVESKGIDFIDYDGTLLYSFTKAEAQALTELPAGPTHDGLVFDGWNWTLSEVQNVKYIAIIGAVYHTSSGATEFDIELTTTTGKTITLQNLTGMTSIDWGDGTTDTSLTHTYTNYGEYTIKVYGVTSFGNDIFNQNNNAANHTLKRVRTSNSLIEFTGYPFRYCRTLQEVILSSAITNIGNHTFQSSYSLTSIIIPNGITIIGGYFVNTIMSLKKISLPNSIKTIDIYALQYCYSLKEIILPKNLETLNSSSLNTCYSILIYDFSNCTQVPSMSSTNVLTNLNKISKIIVPDTLYDDWIVATNWSTYADYIYKASEVA